MNKILYVASTYRHLKSFHLDYIKFLSNKYQVDTLSNGKESTFDVPFEKNYFSLNNLKLIKKIRKIILDGNYSAIIINTSLASFLVRMALKKIKDRPLVINIVHGYLFTKDDSFIKKNIFLLIEKHLKKQTDYILTMNEEDLHIASKFHLATKVVNIDSMGVKTLGDQDFNPYDSTKYNILYVGELSKRKNQMLILKAIKKLIKTIPNAHFNFLGDGKFKSKYVSYVKNEKLDQYVTFFGQKENPSNYYKYCDLYISTSLCEGLPFNILEACYYNKKIVCSNIKGHHDINKIDQYLFLFDNQKEMIKQVQNVYYCNYNKTGKKTFEYYVFSRVFPRNMDLIDNILEGKK